MTLAQHVHADENNEMRRRALHEHHNRTLNSDTSVFRSVRMHVLHMPMAFAMFASVQTLL